MSARPTAVFLAAAEQALQEGRLTAAIAALQQVTRIDPSDAPVWHDLGYLCLQAGRPADAAAAFQAATQIDPTFKLAMMRLGVALQTLGHIEPALAAYRIAREGPGLQAEAGYRLGALLETLGRRAQALAAFRSTAGMTQSSLGLLSSARAYLIDDQDAQAEAELRALLLQDPSHAAGHDLLGLVLANKGQFTEARACYEKAIAAAPLLAGSYYDLVRCRRVTQDDAPLVARMKAALSTPGLPPSGAVRVHLALGKAADDLGDPQQAFAHFDAADSIRSGLTNFDFPAFQAKIARAISQFATASVAPGPVIPRPAPIFIVGAPRSGTTLVEQILSSHPDVHPAGELPFWTEWAAALEAAPADRQADLMHAAARDYAGLLAEKAPGARFVTDKAPLNLLHIGLIQWAFPGVRIVHCRRGLIDTAVSIHQTYFNPHVPFPTGGAALVDTLRCLRQLGAHWQAALGPAYFHDLDYHQLIESPEATIRRLVAFCGLSWSDACLEPEANQRVIKTPSKWQARQPIQRPSRPGWRRFEPWLGPLAALLDEP